MNFTSRFKCSSWAFSVADFSSRQYTRENWFVSDLANNDSEYFNLKIKYEHVKKAPKNPPKTQRQQTEQNDQTKNTLPTLKRLKKEKCYHVLSVLFLHTIGAEKLMLCDVFKLGFQQDLGTKSQNNPFRKLIRQSREDLFAWALPFRIISDSVGRHI